MFIRIKDYIFAVDQLEYITLAKKKIVVMLKNGYMTEVRFDSEDGSNNEYEAINRQLHYISQSVLSQILYSGEKKK